MFPCKQNGEKGIIVVTMIIKPQTRKIHKMDWWLWKCSITSKVQTVLNILYIRAETGPKQTSTPPAMKRPRPRGRRPGPLRRSQPPVLPGGAGASHQVRGGAEGFRLHPVRSTCIIGPISE